MNLALVNYHFGDKLQLYTEVLRRAMNVSRLDILDRVNDAEADPILLLHELVAEFLRHLKKKETALDILMRHERSRPTPAMDFITQRTTRPAYDALCAVIGRVLKLPAAHETTRMVAQSLIAQIRHFGDPERNVSRLDPLILAGKSDEELASSIISFSLAGPYPHGARAEIATKTPRKSTLRTSPKKLHSIQP